MKGAISDRKINRFHVSLVAIVILLLLNAYLIYTVQIRSPAEVITDDQAISIARDYAKPPKEAALQFSKLFNLSGEQRYVVSWRVKDRLIEVQLNVTGGFRSILDYPLPREEIDNRISRPLAYQLAEDHLRRETNYTSDSMKLTGPRIALEPYDNASRWAIFWFGRKNGFMLADAHYLTFVDAQTGDVWVAGNTLDLIPSITVPDKVNVSEQQALSIMERELGRINATLIETSEVILGVLEHPANSSQYIPYWTIYAKAVMNDWLFNFNFNIDASTGKVYFGYY